MEVYVENSLGGVYTVVLNNVQTGRPECILYGICNFGDHFHNVRARFFIQVIYIRDRFPRYDECMTFGKRECICESNAYIILDRKSTRLNSSHVSISYAVFCLKKKKNDNRKITSEICRMCAIATNVS